MPPSNRPLPALSPSQAHPVRASVRLNGRDFYLGTHDTPASKEKYNRLLSEWLANNRQLRPTTSPTDAGSADGSAVTVAEICVRFIAHADAWYRGADGEPTNEPQTLRQALRPLSDLYARLPVTEFGPIALKAVRQHMITVDDWCRTHINKQISRIKSMFKWAKNEQLVPPGVFDAIRDLPGLRRGRSEARESKPVKPVPIEYVAAVRPFISDQVGAMIELQLLTGMRPGEVCGMRGVDIQQRGKIWTYTPAAHKTAHHGHGRKIWLGPQQDIVKRFLKPNLMEPLFSPLRSRDLQE